jgi:hypothetical protein
MRTEGCLSTYLLLASEITYRIISWTLSVPLSRQIIGYKVQGYFDMAHRKHDSCNISR